MNAPAPTEAYPLTWPALQPRTPALRRRDAKFTFSLGRARDDLIDELRLLGSSNVVVSSNIPTRRDGLPYAAARSPDDPGVAVYFDRIRIVPGGSITPRGGGTERRSYVLACDSYRRVEWNLRAIGVTVEALRTIQRHGATEMLEQAFTGFAALPPPSSGARDWWVVLGVERSANAAHIREAFRELARIHHPDTGGSTERMAEINAAYEAARRQGVVA